MPFTTDAIAAQQVRERLKSLYQLVHDVDKKRQQSEAGVNAVNRYQASHDDHDNSDYQSRLKSLYVTAMQQAEQEEDLLREALLKISEIRNIKHERRIQSRLAGNKETARHGPWMKMLLNSAQTLPLFVGKPGEKPHPLCGAVPAEPGYVAKVGDMVAALAAVDGGDWIVAEVVSFNHSTNKYEVDDILEEHNQKTRYTLNKRSVIPLPLMKANPETDPNALFPLRTVVLALFPQTSCFYKAVVSKLPATHTDNYELLFEDLSYPQGYSPPYCVPQRYVIAFKEKTKPSRQQVSECSISDTES